jgi:hypothetical protein
MRFTCNSIAIRLPHIINDSPLQPQTKRISTRVFDPVYIIRRQSGLKRTSQNSAILQRAIRGY